MCKIFDKFHVWVCWKLSYIFVISSWNTADSLFQLNGFLQMFAAFSNYRQLFPAVECLPAVDSKFPAVDSKIKSFNKFSHARVTSVNSQQKEWVTDKAIQWSKLSKIWPENSAIFPIALEQGQRRDQAQFGGNSGIFARLDLIKTKYYHSFHKDTHPMRSCTPPSQRGQCCTWSLLICVHQESKVKAWNRKRIVSPHCVTNRLLDTLICLEPKDWKCYNLHIISRFFNITKSFHVLVTLARYHSHHPDHHHYDNHWDDSRYWSTTWSLDLPSDWSQDRLPLLFVEPPPQLDQRPRCGKIDMK